MFHRLFRRSTSRLLKHFSEIDVKNDVSSSFSTIKHFSEIDVKNDVSSSKNGHFRKLVVSREILRLMKISVFQQQIFIGISSKYGFIGGTLTKVVTKGQIANLATNPYVILFSRKTRKHEIIFTKTRNRSSFSTMNRR